MNNFNAVITIAMRDLTKLLRDRGRMLASLAFPLIFIGILGSSMQSNIGNDIGYNFLTFVFIGVIGQTLFQSTAGGLISLVEDKQNDFSQELFISPVSRYAIIFGKIVGETLVSFVQILGVFIFAFVFRVPFDLWMLFSILPFAFLAAILGGAFGLLVMANMNDQRSANQLFPFLLFPQFFLAGVFNPIKILPLPLMILSRIAPMTYAVDLLRSIYYWGTPAYEKTVLFNPITNILVVTGFSIVFLISGTLMFVRNERNR
jgi:ABC-2 type transport system permease protein